MKKRLALILSAVMALSVLLSAFGTVTASAAKSSGDYVDAIMSNITLDGVADAKEYVVDKVTENFYIGAAWNETEKMLYIYTLDAIGGNYTMEIGGKTLTVGSKITGIDGVDGVALGGYTEIAIPINKLSLGFNGTYATVNMKITTKSSGTEFDGKVIFTDYSNLIALNEIQPNSSTYGVQINAVNAAESETLYTGFYDNAHTLRMVDKNADETMTRLHFSMRHADLSSKTNQYFEFDLKVNALPYESFFREDQGSWKDSPHTRLWIVMKYASNAQYYLNVINTAEGIVLLVQRTGKDPEVVTLGKQLGEKFTLSLVGGANGDFLVRVDGKTVAKTTGVSMSGSNIGSSSGVCVINLARNNALPAGGADVEISNVSMGLRSTAYDSTNGIYYNLDNLLALSTTPVDKTVVDDEDTEGDDNGYTISGATILSGGTASTDTVAGGEGTATTEEEGGCGSSIAGMGIVMVLGTALTAVVAAKKKED